MTGNLILERIGVDRYRIYTTSRRVLQWVFAPFVIKETGSSAQRHACYSVLIHSAKRSRLLILRRCRTIGSTSSQLGPAAMSTFRGTFKSSADVMRVAHQLGQFRHLRGGRLEHQLVVDLQQHAGLRSPARAGSDRAGSWPA